MAAYAYPTPCDMPFQKYRPFRPLGSLPDRTWPDRQLDRRPGVVQRGPARRQPGPDRSDGPGPQAAVLRDAGRAWGSRRSRSVSRPPPQPDFDFIRQIIDEDRIPDDVAIQVLVQCRPELIERTFEAIAGAPHAIVHFYNSTSTLQRRVVFGLDKDGITDIATSAARLVRKHEDTIPETRVSYEYSPESFTGTEPDYAVEICEAVMDVIEPAPDRKMIVNLPNTVEMYGPNTYADVIEWFGRHVRQPGFDRAERAPPQRPGHRGRGRRAGPAGRRRPGGGHPVRQRRADRQRGRGHPGPQPFLPGRRPPARPARHRPPAPGGRVLQPAAGPSPPPLRRRPGLHRLLRARTRTPSRRAWTPCPTTTRPGKCPTCPIDPKHVGRTYEAIIRVNSQSGKGGVAYLMDTEHGLDLPRALQVEFSKQVQAVTEASGTEIKPGELWDVFASTYLPDDAGIRLISSEVSSGGERGPSVVAQVLVDGHHRTIVRPGQRSGRRPRQRPPGRAGPRGVGRGLPRARPDRRQRGLRGRLRPGHRSRTGSGPGGSASTRASSMPRCRPSSAPPTGCVADRLRGARAGRLGSPPCRCRPAEEQAPPRGHVRVVYLGPVAPHWRVDSDFGDRAVIEEFRQRALARLLLLPPHDPQFRRNRERVVRDAERENLLLDWDLGEPEE